MSGLVKRGRGGERRRGERNITAFITFSLLKILSYSVVFAGI